MQSCPQHGAGNNLHPEFGTCTVCQEQHRSALVGRTRLRREDAPLKYDFDDAYRLRQPSLDPKVNKAFLDHILNDPIKSAQLALMTRRQPGVSKERFGVAARAAGREPMLCANPESVVYGLDSSKVSADQRSKALAKAGVAERLSVKPLSGKNAKLGRNSAYWGCREWLVFVLKYSKGYVVRTDTGEESSVFRSVGQLKEAIRKSGWEIL